MNSSTQRKVALGILGLALSALVVDKAVLGPSGAKAAPVGQGLETGAPPAAAPSPRAVVQGRPSPRASGAAIDNRLKVAAGAAKWSAGDVVDSLRRSPAWATEGQGEAGSAADTFRQKHELKAIMSPKGAGESGRIAMIGGRPLRTGEQLDGYTLVSVGARSAVFEAGPTRVVLSLKGLPDENSVNGR